MKRINLRQSLLYGTLIGSVFFASLAGAQTTAQDLPKSIHQKIQALNLSPDEVSIWVKPLDGQAPIISHHAKTLRVPASTQKLITTLVALDSLGANHHWYTHIYKKGVVVAGTLYGDIVIKGTGDPSLTHERLRALFGHLFVRGIRHIQGDILVDNGAFFGVNFDVNAFDGYGLRAYNAAPNALLVNFGTLQIDIVPSGTYHTSAQMGKTGQPVQVFVPTDNRLAMLKVAPTLADFDVPNTIGASAGACQSEPQFGLSPTALKVSGIISAACGHNTRWLTFANGDEFALKAIKGTWQQFDPSFAGEVKLYAATLSSLALPVVSYPSRALAAQIYDINQYSNNVMTEQVALSLPLSVGETISTYPKAFAFINHWWKTHLNSPAPVMSRASGLCRDCQVSPSAMGELLEFAYRQPYFSTFKHSLPIAGRTGTMARLAYRSPNHPAIERAFIKTGTLDDVVSMAGYVVDSQGRYYVVVGMINAPHASGRGAVSVLDELLAVVAQY